MNDKSSMTFDVKEAARIMREEPDLKHYEAINKAKLLFKQKELSDGNLKSSRGKTNLT